MSRETNTETVCDSCGTTEESAFSGVSGRLKFERCAEAIDGHMHPVPAVNLEDLCAACTKGIGEAINGFQARNAGELRFVCDGPPGHEPGRFVELENQRGEGLGLGEWREMDNGMWALCIPAESLG